MPPQLEKKCVAETSRRNWSLMGLEWRWSLANLLWGLPAGIASFALPAWAVKMTAAFASYAPASWVAAGFLGLLVYALAFIGIAWGRGKWVRSRYDARMLPNSGPIDPMDKTFERRRIFLNEFALPSHPLIVGKTFIDCEIIGPANVILQTGNMVTEHMYPVCDTVLMHSAANPYNGYIFRNCTFKGCSFQRLTLLVPVSEYQMTRGVDWLNWITPYPDGESQIRLPLEPNVGSLAQAEEAQDDKGK